MQLLAPLYRHVSPFLVSQPEFATGAYAFVFCSDSIGKTLHLAGYCRLSCSLSALSCTAELARSA
jgi:hypothetical protein